MKKLLLYCVLLIFTNSHSQYTQQWENRLNGSANSFDIANNMFLDEQSNAYVYSTISNAGNVTDICAIKYSSSGQEIWRFVFNGPSSSIDQLQDVYKDAQNNSYLTGYTSDNGNIKLLTIKLNSSGDTVWTRINTIAGYENLIAHSIISDNGGNIFVMLDARNINTGRGDFIILKYSQSGNIMGQKIYQSPAVSMYNGVKIICDANDNIFAGVNYKETQTGFDIMIYKLDNNLNEVYSKRINGTANSDDGVIDMKLAYDNNIIFTGKLTNSKSSSDIGTFKLNNTSGDIVWQKNYNGSGNNIDLPYALAFDNLNNILVTGYTRNSTSIGSEDIITLKYDANGNLLWSRVYNDSVNGTDQGYSICADAHSNVYIGGAADNGSGHLGYLTLKYNSEGTLVWKGIYHYYHLSEDFIYKVAVNNTQDIFVSGISFSNVTDYDVATIKYSFQTGIYSGPEVVNDFKLYQNFPNPFNPSTIIKFYNPRRNFISLKIFDLQGKEISILENNFLNEGDYEYEFDAASLSSGIYFYKVFYGNNFKTGRMVLSR